MNVVYLVTNVRNGKQYVGVTKKGLEKRKREHLWAAPRFQHKMPFHAAIRKYGSDAFIWELYV